MDYVRSKFEIQKVYAIRFSKFEFVAKTQFLNFKM